MRLVSYNILNGGEGRADPLAEVILAQRPDVVALIEADVPMVIERIGRRLGMQPYVGAGARHAVAIFSRWPVLQSIDHSTIDPAIDRGMLEVVVETPDGLELPVVALHLPAGATLAAETHRLHIWERVMQRLQAHRGAGRSHLLCGDFNATAPSEVIDPNQCKQATRDAYVANGNRLPRQLITAVETAGYVDTFNAADGRTKVAGTLDTQMPGQRVDYIFAYGFDHEQMTSAWVEQDRLAKYASDHFPVGVDLRLPTPARVGA